MGSLRGGARLPRGGIVVRLRRAVPRSRAALASTLIAGAGLVGVAAAGSPDGAFVLRGAPLAQVISAVLIERRTLR